MNFVNLWNVVFPADRNVWYDEEDEEIHDNEEAVGYAEADRRPISPAEHLRSPPAPDSALQHCTEDIARASAIVAHAAPLPRVAPDERLHCTDLLRIA